MYLPFPPNQSLGHALGLHKSHNKRLCHMIGISYSPTCLCAMCGTYPTTCQRLEHMWHLLYDPPRTFDKLGNCHTALNRDFTMWREQLTISTRALAYVWDLSTSPIRALSMCMAYSIAQTQAFGKCWTYPTTHIRSLAIMLHLLYSHR